ncbi:MAG: hypothetical protein HQL82_02765 [Magnetococcales bacterium]|nr:hypothetical protein [Magnetococcales bacterium]
MAATRPPLHLLLTVDVETWPASSGPPGRDFPADFRRCVLGTTPGGTHGLACQLEILARHRLKGSFFVEPLFAGAVAGGSAWLAQTIALIRTAGQEIQLHPHTEWLAFHPTPLVPPRPRSDRMFCFDGAEQERIVRRGLELLSAGGAGPITAFRAGSFGADDATLQALARCGIPFDTSFDPACTGTECRIGASRALKKPSMAFSTSGTASKAYGSLTESTDWKSVDSGGASLPRYQPIYQRAARPPARHPVWLDGVWEFPVGRFCDRGAHERHLQLTACSFAELAAMIRQAHRRGWTHLVLLSHSFELLNRTRTRVDPVVMDRFVRLCRFLETNRDWVITVGFEDVDPATLGSDAGVPALRSHRGRTLWRQGEQALRWLFEDWSHRS